MNFPPHPTRLLLTAGLASVAIGFGLAIAQDAGKAEMPDGTQGLRVLFLGHEAQNHRSDLYYPMIQQALGREAIYFDYTTSVEEALGDADYLNSFDALLLYANHQTIEPQQWANLLAFVEEEGKGFVPVHCASWCFQNEPGYDRLVGGRFKSHQGRISRPRTVAPEHRAIVDVPEFEAWDETYFHANHNEEGRTVLQVREAFEGDPHTEPEPWTWVREQGAGRVFYTASGHDHRVWEKPEFHQLLRKGILWAVGEERAADHAAFVEGRAPLRYEKRDFIANYENRPEPLPFQHPLSPEESMSYTRVPLGFRLELFAAEPDIINPIAMSWDERGRLWAIQTIDYPNTVRSGDAGDDCIKILEDTDRDGRCDKVTVFAEGLNIPTSLTHYDGGVLVHMAPQTIFLKDTDGDDVADLREVVLEGWGTGDTHAGPSNLRVGMDNWIWGAVGYSRFKGEVGGVDHDFGSGLYRFRPDGSAIEFLYQFNNNTWGLGFNAAGDVFGSTANNNPSFSGTVPATVEGGGKSAEMIADSPAFHPITPNVRQVDAFGAYTAGAGHAFANSGGFPEAWRGRRAFVCGPTGHLLGAYDCLPEGAGYVAKNAYSVVASADEWFSPIMAEVGPDGALWIADWYNFIIQHNPTPSEERGGFAGERGPGNAHVNPLRDREHGRIYRLVWDGAPAPETTDLSEASTEELIAALDDPNQFWRLTAQRLLVEGADPAAAGALAGRATDNPHAMWAATALGEFPAAALTSADPVVRRNAVRALPPTEAGADLLFATSVLQDSDPLVRAAAILKLAQFPPSERSSRAAVAIFSDAEVQHDPHLAAAAKAALGAQDVSGDLQITFGENLLPNPSFEEVDGEDKVLGWTVRTYAGRADHIHAQGEPHAHSGRRGLRIVSTREGGGADTSFFTDVEVKPNTDYRLSGWVRTTGVSGAMGALFNVHGTEFKTTPVSKRSEWTELELTFNSGARRILSINCLFGGWGKSTGTAWFDEVALQEVVYGVGGSTAEGIVGKAEAGGVIFRENEMAGCFRCHQLGGEGGVIGPALDGIASRKEEGYLLEALTKPAAVLAEGFEHLGASPMPPMNLILTEQELADVMAFLLTLKAE